jgi:hypothetical protein
MHAIKAPFMLLAFSLFSRRPFAHMLSFLNINAYLYYKPLLSSKLLLKCEHYFFSLSYSEEELITAPFYGKLASVDGSETTTKMHLFSRVIASLISPYIVS